MKLILLPILIAAAFAQTNPPLTLTLTGPATISVGDASDVLTVTLTGTKTTNLSAFSFAGSLPTGITVSGPIATSPALTQLGKTVFCNVTAALFSCFAVGLSNSVVSNQPILSDITVATIPISVTSTTAIGTAHITFSNLNAADITAAIWPLNSGATYSPVVTAAGGLACDVNGDGKIDASDVLAVGNSIDGSTTACGIKAGCTVQNMERVVMAASGNSLGCTLPVVVTTQGTATPAAAVKK